MTGGSNALEIELLENSSIKIRLTKEDLEHLNISVEDFNCSSIETRRVLWTLLDAARYELKIDIDLSERMLIEIMPNKNGGCCIFITGLENKTGKSAKRVGRKNMKPQFFDFDGIDNLISATCALKTVVTSNNQLSELYRMDSNGYRLLIYPDSELSGSLWAILSEYCRNRGDGNIAAAFTREHGELIAGGDAIGKICKYCGS